jgi:acetyl-CoA synthetase/4-hydroxybutyrate---CoA ligase (AMP-forming)
MDIVEFYKKFIASDSKTRNEMLGELKSISMEHSFNWVSDIFEKLFANKNKDALIYFNEAAGRESRISYLELYEKYNKFINFIRRMGVKKGASIYIMAGAVPEQWFTMMGSLKAGFTVIPTAPNLTEYEIKFRFSQDPPDVVISDMANADKLVHSLSNRPLKLLIGDKGGWINFNEIEKMPTDADAAELNIDDVFIKYFTSGTTGMPKAVKHSSILYPMGQLSTLAAIGIRQDYIHNNLSSPGWAKFAWSSFFAPLCAGATVLSIDYRGKLNLSRYLELIDRYKVNSFCAPPTAWRQFLSLKNENVKLESLKETVSAGEPLNGEVINKWKERYGTTIRDFYGQSESTAMAANLPDMKIIPGSMGKPLKSYNISLVDDEMNEIKSSYTIGNIAVGSYKGTYGLFLGYSDPEKNATVFINGYYLTGDKAYFDDSEYFYFVSRTDDVIKTSDYRVGPFEVESAIIKNEAVLESAVIGVPDPIKYEKIKAFVILKDGYEKNEETAKSIYNTVKSMLPYYKHPRIIEFINDLPKTISGKIKRKELKAIEIEKANNNGSGEFVYHF